MEKPGYVIRLENEFEELTNRIEKLSAFISTDTFKSLDEIEQDDLLNQLEVMIEYSAILNRRLGRITY